MVLVTTCGVTLNVGVGDRVTAAMVRVMVGVGVARLSGARERAINPMQ